MKKEYLFKKEEYNTELDDLKYFCEIINQYWDDLTSVRPLTYDDIQDITSFTYRFYNTLWNEEIHKICDEYGIKYDTLQHYYEQDSLAFVKTECTKRLGHVKSALSHLIEIDKNNGRYYACKLHSAPYLIITDKGLKINEKEVKEYFTVYITNNKQEKALKLMQEVAKNSNELVKLGLNYFNNYYWFSGEEYGINGEGIIEDLQGE